MTTSVHIWGRLSSLNVRKLVRAAQEVGVDCVGTAPGQRNVKTVRDALCTTEVALRARCTFD